MSGLEAKRARAHVEEKSMPDKMKKLEAAAGAPVKVEIKWDEFTDANDIQMIPNGFFDRFTNDIQKLCKDKLGKEAFAGAVKTVVVHCVADPKAKKFELKDGVMSVWGAWGKSDGYIGYEEYRKYLEKNL